MLFLCLAAAPAGALTLDVETGTVGAVYNEVQVPDMTGTRFSLTDDIPAESKAFYRLRVTEEFKKNNYVSVLIAPLMLDADGTAEGLLSFNGDIFPAGTKISAKYRFDSYRVSYWKRFEKKGRLSFKLGFTAKIRDASISVAGAGITSEKKNTGFVPLLNFGVDYDLGRSFTAVLDADALAGGPGRAEDVLLAVNLKTSERTAVRAGFRVVEGGADVDEVFNFAQLNYTSIGFSYSF
ncbi:MAG: hypothetical protein JW803_07795 [Endomicrobiales bacterium]|nr:hypothetical protein [Endomicrobiales bacterium]